MEEMWLEEVKAQPGEEDIEDKIIRAGIEALVEVIVFSSIFNE